MGFFSALKTRFALANGESFGAAVRIFLASKQDRRRIAARKFPGQDVPSLRSLRLAGEEPPSELYRDLLDALWYAETNGFSLKAPAWEHFLETGLAAGLAPMPALAGPDGRHLSIRGAEFLYRLGLPLGTVSSGPLLPADATAVDPWELGHGPERPLAVVTAITKAYERLAPVPLEWTENAEFFAISDFAFPRAAPWQLVRPVFQHNEASRRALFVKAHLATFFSRFDRVLWIDPDVLLCGNPAELPLSKGRDIACFRLEERSLGAEAAAVAASGEDAPEVVARFLAEIGSHPGALRPGLIFDPAVLLLHPSRSAVRRLAACWWRYIMRGSSADRLSFGLAVADTQELRIDQLPGERLDRSPFFARRGAI